MQLAIYQVDAFTDRLFGGNPAAVCPLAAWLPDAMMQAIAAENNLSETAFFVPRGDDYDLRWFTPTLETDLCGHATQASGFVVMNRLAPQKSTVRFHTKSGALSVTRQGEVFAIDLPAQPPVSCTMPQKFVAALGHKPVEILGAIKSPGRSAWPRGRPPARVRDWPRTRRAGRSAHVSPVGRGAGRA